MENIPQNQPLCSKIEKKKKNINNNVNVDLLQRLL